MTARTFSWRVWRQWLVAATCGELLGFGVPAVVGAFAVDLPLPVETASLVAAGTVEGALLGLAQGLVVRRVIPAITAGRWSYATAVGAAMAWAIAMGGVAIVQAAPPSPVVALAAPVLSAGLLLTIGVAQWWLLRRHVKAAWRWIYMTAAAWVVGLTAFTATTTPLWMSGQSVRRIAAIGVLGGLVMAATMAAITGWAFVRIVAQPLSDDPARRNRAGFPTVRA